MKIILGSLLSITFVDLAANSENDESPVTAMVNATNCVKLSIYNNNNTFCGVTRKWTPRISKSEGIWACVIPSVIAWFLCIVLFSRFKNKILDTYKRDINKRARDEEKLLGRWRKPLYLIKGESCLTSFGIYLKVVCDAIDVTLDSVIFRDLEFGGLIDENIYRNSHVNNAILAFAVLGCLKLLILIFYPPPVGTQDGLIQIDCALTLIAFYLEDGAELILEYFYIEKYVSNQPPIYLIIKDLIICAFDIYTIYKVASQAYGVYKMEEKWKTHTLLFLLSFSTFALLNVLRFCGAFYQYITGDLERACFDLQNGQINQVPLETGCARGIDYIIVIVCCIAFAMLPILLRSFILC